MQEKLLFNLIEEIAGENNGRIVDTLFNKKDVNEFLIAKKMELTINQVRNILYKLSNLGLVSFIRKKDKKKGWYIYYWTLSNEKSLALIENHLRKKISDLEEQLKFRETKRYYTCPYCHIEVEEDIALENGFSCEECAEIYQLSDNSPFVRDIKSKITRINNEITEINVELTSLRQKQKKKIEKQNKKIADDKAEEKLRNREIRAKKTSETKEISKKLSEDKVNKKPVLKKVKTKLILKKVDNKKTSKEVKKQPKKVINKKK